MSLRVLLVLVSIILISCTASKVLMPQKDMDRTEITENRNFNGELIPDLSGIAVTRSVFKNNKIVSVKYYDINNKLVKNEKSWLKQNAEWRFQYDDNGNFIKQTAHDSNGELFDVEHWSNSAIEVLEYNEKNQLIQKSNFDKSMKLVGLGDIGDAVTKYGYNKNGQLIWKKCFNTNMTLIENGFCYSKFEYNLDHTLNRMTYLFDESKMNNTSEFEYDGGKLIQEKSLNAEGGSIGYKIYKYTNSETIESIEDWYYKWDDPQFISNEITIDLEGWKMSEMDLKSIDIKKAGKGEYEIIVNESGEISNIAPLKYKGGKLPFNNEVYNEFREITFLKDSIESSMSGTMKIVILDQEIGIFRDIEKILKPTPNY